MKAAGYPSQAIVFPNNGYKEFKDIKDYILYLSEDLPNSTPKGQYFFHSFNRVKNIRKGTIVLFRYRDRIIGKGRVYREAVKSLFVEGKNKYEGYLLIEAISLLKEPLTIQRLEELTDTSFHQKGRSYSTGGRVYQRIPEVMVKKVLDEIKLREVESAGTPNDKDIIYTADKELGDLGEKFILKVENERLSGTGLMAEKVKDGTGYDIKSWDQYRKEIHIEVKTTTGGLESKIFWTRNEHFSSLNDKNYWIYRVYNFNREKMQGEIKRIKGSFEESFGNDPYLFFGSYSETVHK